MAEAIVASLKAEKRRRAGRVGGHAKALRSSRRDGKVADAPHHTRNGCGIACDGDRLHPQPL
jgi:hypothetical protein